MRHQEEVIIEKPRVQEEVIVENRGYGRQEEVIVEKPGFGTQF